MPSKQTKFILAIALQIVVIVSIIIFKLSVLTGGTDIMLKIVPVDPRDVLRGDYVTFEYEISSVESYYARSERIKNGDMVYVVLSPDGKYYGVSNIQKNKPVNGQLFIKGRVDRGAEESQADVGVYRTFGGVDLHIVYGIEEYYIPEGKGRNMSFWNTDAAARVSVDENGNAALKSIYVNDKVWP
ncbi:MAG: GDYXXLXY domain-containing protein [Patescibacteria group bacterium]